MFHKGKFKFAALVGIALSMVSLLVHLLLSSYPSGDFIQCKLRVDDFYPTGQICDLVAIARLLNATLVIPEIQGSLRSKGIMFFLLILFFVPNSRVSLHLYNEEQSIAALSNDVVVVKNLPNDLKEARTKTKFPTISP